MLAKKKPYISSVYQHLQVISQDEEKHMEYEAREKVVRDYSQGILKAEARIISQSLYSPKTNATMTLHVLQMMLLSSSS